FFQAEDGIRYRNVTGVQTCALPIWLEHVFARQIEREQEHERAISRNEGTQRTDEKLYQSSHERGNGERSHDTQSIESDSRKIGQSHEQHAINFEHARQDVRRKR